MIRFTLVLEDEKLNQWLVEQAKRQGRSRNKQIEWLLKSLMKQEQTENERRNP